MSDNAAHPTQSWPVNLALRIEMACSRFEEAWKGAAASGRRPRIEDYLHSFAAAECPAALPELVALDIAYRTIHGEQPAVADYQARFPEQTAQVQRAFEELKSLLPPMTQPSTQNRLPGTLSFPPGEKRGPAETWPAIPGYEFLGILGRGGMGVVFQARQLRPKRIVALKMLRDAALAGPDHLARFHQETEIIAKLHHPNIVQIYEVGERGGQPYFSLEFMEGGSLAHRLQGTPQPSRAAAELTETLARAVDAAHRRGIIHRDLKPSNVLLTAEGLPKISDFGLAKWTAVAAEPVGECMTTQTGIVMGTASYMPPEQARGDQQHIGPATDVYALGAILYEMLVGRPPFKAATMMQTLHELLEDEPVPPRRLQRSIPHDLETICLKCLHKEPERRYESAAALAADLHHFRAGEPIQARPASAWERAVKWTRRRPATAALVALGTAAVVGLLAVTLWFNAKLRKDIADARADERIKGLQAEVHKEGADAATALADKRATEARNLLSNALQKIANEPDFEDLRAEVAAKLAQAELAVERDQAEALAVQKHRKFLGARDDVLFRAGFLLLGDAAPAERTAIRDAARAALQQFVPIPDDLKPGDIAKLDLGGYTGEQQAEIRAGCHELWFVLTDDDARAKKRPPSTALDYCLLGIEQLRTGPTAPAIKTFDEALHKQPHYFWAQYLLGVAHLRADSAQPDVRTANARTALAYLSALDKDRSPLVYLVRGVAHGQLRDHPAAEEDFKAALSLHPDLGTEYAIHINRGVVRIMGENLAGGIKEFEKASELQSNRFEAYFNLAQAYEKQGRAALEQAQRVQARIGSVLSPEAPVAQGLLLALAAAEQIRMLLAAHEQLDLAFARRKGAWAPLHRVRAGICRELNQLEAAQEAIEEAIELDRTVAEYHAEQGRILMDLGQFPDAVRAFQSALMRPGASPSIHASLAEAHWALADHLDNDPAAKRSNYKAAVKAYGRYLASPEEPRTGGRVRWLRGLLQLKLKAYANAISDFNAAEEEQQPNADLYFARGSAYLALNDLRAAELDFSDVLGVEPNNGYALNGWALVSVKRAQDERTISQGVAKAERAVALGSWARPLVYDAARVYAQAFRRSGELGLLKRVRDTYENRAIFLLGMALRSIESSKARQEFWKATVLKDPELEPIRGSRGFQKLADDLSLLVRAD